MRYLVTVLLLALAACSAAPVPQPLCNPGASVACTCTNGASGAQVCDVTRVLTACVCSDGGASPLDGAPQDGGDTDAPADLGLSERDVPSAFVDVPIAVGPDVPPGPDSGLSADVPPERDGGTPSDAPRPMDAGPGPDATFVYAHSETVLYEVNPRTNALRRVGPFTFPSGDRNNHSMNDVAVDADGTLVGNSQDALYRINTTTAACSLISPLPDGNFVGLTYLPAGLLPGTTGEVLVGGLRDGTYWRIDASTGRSTRLGQLRRGGTTYALSGDFVSIAGAGTFATVRATNASSSSHDLLATMNPATGELSLASGNTGFDAIFGLAYYRDTLYGFTRDGEFIRINIRTGVGTLVPTLPPTVEFYGAGVTTTAPTAPP